MKKTRIYNSTAAKLIFQTRESSEKKMAFTPEKKEVIRNEIFLLHKRNKQGVIDEITKMINDCYNELDPVSYKSIVSLNYMKRVKINNCR